MGDEETNKTNMKGILNKINCKWVVKQVIKEGTQDRLINMYPLIDNGHIDGLALYDSNEGIEVDFEIVIDIDNNGPEHFPKFARILTTEEDELKDWDVTLMDGLENEPYVSDDFQIGPDGAYEHTEDIKSTGVFEGEAKWHRSAYIKLENNKVIFDCSNEEYGPIVFDIELLKDALNKHIK